MACVYFTLLLVVTVLCVSHGAGNDEIEVPVLASDGFENPLLDESTANLDEKTKNLIFDYLKSKTYTIINATHDIDKFDNITSHYKLEILENGIRHLKKVF